jgi:hypothetical protein
MLGFLLGAVAAGLGYWCATTLPFGFGPWSLQYYLQAGFAVVVIAPLGGVAGGAFASRLARRWYKMKP